MYPLAFPEENLVPLVRDLLTDPGVALSLVATIESEIVGHVSFTSCAVDESNVAASLLAPLAVAPDYQRRGIGSALVHKGHEKLSDSNVDVVFVLGDPAYYSCLGFRQEPDVQPPYPLPAEWYVAWQSQYLGEVTTAGSGKLAVPSQWLDPALWAP